MRNNEIVIHEKVQFDFDKATIKAVSHSLLDEVADVIQKNPQIKKIEVQGHASSEGDADHNMRLSENRAAAVMDYLLSKGVPKEMLTSKGYGITQPIADNGTKTGARRIAVSSSSSSTRTSRKRRWRSIPARARSG